MDKYTQYLYCIPYAYYWQYMYYWVSLSESHITFIVTTVHTTTVCMLLSLTRVCHMLNKCYCEVTGFMYPFFLPLPLSLTLSYHFSLSCVAGGLQNSDRSVCKEAILGKSSSQHTHTRTHTHTHTRTHRCMYTHMHAHTHARTHTDAHSVIQVCKFFTHTHVLYFLFYCISLRTGERDCVCMSYSHTSTLVCPVLLLSWGVKWGIDGYFKMVRRVGKCGVDQQVAVADLGGVQGVQLNPPFLGILNFCNLYPPKKLCLILKPAYY